jgi:DNA polymerase phi
MGSTSKNKRNNSVSDEHDETKDSHDKPLNKKPKTTDSTATPSSTKPTMETHKKSKAFDKKRRSDKLKSKSKSEPIDLDSEPTASDSKPAADSTSGSGGDSPPEFHIGVFKDLAVVNESARSAAAKQMVTELKAIQNAYGGVQEMEIGDGGFKLEAEKNDGLDECAPSVRYAVRRLIRGVSSSREVCFCVLFGSYIVIINL